MRKINLSDIVNLPAFEEAGALFYQATGMTLSFRNEDGVVLFYPAEQRCGYCQLIQSTPDGRERCRLSDDRMAEKALRARRPLAYTCHAGLIDVVVPVVVGDDRIGCFYSGQSLLEAPVPEDRRKIRARATRMGLDPDQLAEAYLRVPVVDRPRLDLAMGLLSIICNHLVEGEIALRSERALTMEQRKLRKSAEETARLERDLREMELRLVQAQLNPHFLFNALNLILGHAISEDAPQTSRLVEDLSLLLRSSLSNIGSLVTLSEELASAESYVQIFRARFGRKVELEISLDDSLRNLKAPSMILQPLVENALIHALPSCDGPFRLRMSAERVGDLVELSVTDSGPGIAKTYLGAVTKALNDSKHEGKLTGLVGLNRRLKYYYPEMPGLRLRNSGNGLTVIISLPG